MKEVILYVGRYELPDKNAAAQRVIANAKAFEECGHEVLFINFGLKKKEKPCWTQYEGFACLESTRKCLVSILTSNKEAFRIIKERKVTCVIAYNYPAIALWKLLRFCKKKGIRCYADATEWYEAKGNLLFRIIKTLDTEWRMQKLHGAMDGVIAISDYLFQYYKDRVFTVKVPPLVDIKDEKWKIQEPLPKSKTVFVYAGSPSVQKECLDLVVHAIEEVSNIREVTLRVVGITKEQYEDMYGEPYNGFATTFVGRVSHRQAIEETTQADWSIIVRENNRVVKAGFPTKLVESISCGTPVIINEFSNVTAFLNENNSIVCDIGTLSKAIEMACDIKLDVDRSVFDYRKHLDAFRFLLCKDGRDN